MPEITQEELDKLKREKDEAERKQREAEQAKATAEAERDALQGDSAALKQEKVDRIAACSKKYRDFRGEHITGRDLVAYEEMLDKMTLAELKIQEDILGVEESTDDGSEGEEEEGTQTSTPPGRSTSDNNRSNRSDDDENAKKYNAENQKVLPPWMNPNRTSRNTV